MGSVVYFGSMSESSNVQWGAVLVMAVFYALIFAVGIYAARRKSHGTAEDMLLAGRALPIWVGVLTMSATWVGGGYINGSAEAAYSNGLVWVQAPWGYSLSMVVGGLFFAPIMRRHGFTTMLDPLHQRFGRRMAALLYLPALTGEIFWSAAILTALGTTFGTVLNLDFTTSILLSAAVAIGYTLIGGLWAVALTDVVQLLLLVGGLWLVAPIAAEALGGMTQTWTAYVDRMGPAASFMPAWGAWRDPAWGDSYWSWWDSMLMLIFGGLPWHAYFQRVLAMRDAAAARTASLIGAAVCVIAAMPAVLIGIVGAGVDWEALGVPVPEPALVLPWVLRYLTDPWIAAVGLGALAAAVMSSVDSSILSASSMGAWNVYRPLWKPDVSADQLTRVIRRTIVIVGVSATVLAVRVQSVYALWYLSSDFVYCILFPQLLVALYDRQANRIGSIAGFAVSFIMRFGGGEPVFGLPALLPYPMIDASGVVLFPFKTLSMLCGLLTIVVVSRLTAGLAAPRALAAPQSGSDTR